VHNRANVIALQWDHAWVGIALRRLHPRAASDAGNGLLIEELKGAAELSRGLETGGLGAWVRLAMHAEAPGQQAWPRSGLDPVLNCNPGGSIDGAGAGTGTDTGVVSSGGICMVTTVADPAAWRAGGGAAVDLGNTKLRIG